MAAERPEKTGDGVTARLAVDFLHRGALHYGIWFNEVAHQLGLEEAIRTEAEVFDRFLPILMRRLGNSLGFAVEDGLPSALATMPPEKLAALADAAAANWLAGDGIWFQAVERRQDMFTAKRCNDTCWTRFSPLEAARIRDALSLPAAGGLDALEAALGLRLYSRINVQSTERQGDALVFKMVNCRVQYARNRKGLEDYPCKSAGVAEYTAFARAIDPRIVTECVACPPDKRPGDWFCAWKFRLG